MHFLQFLPPIFGFYWQFHYKSENVYKCESMVLSYFCSRKRKSCVIVWFETRAIISTLLTGFLGILACSAMFSKSSNTPTDDSMIPEVDAEKDEDKASTKQLYDKIKKLIIIFLLV